MSGNHFLHFGTEWNNQKSFPNVRDKNGKYNNHSRSWGRERKIQETIQVVWVGNGKTQISFPLNGMGTGNLKLL